MTRSEQEKLVERYLGGEMNSSQEEEFFIQVAVNNDLRQTLKAYRVVESAIRKHRDTVPAQHSESRAKIIALLSAGAAAKPHAGSGSSPGPGQPVVGHLTMSPSALRWIIGSVAAVGLTVGVLIVAPMMEKKTTFPPAATAPARKTEAPKFVEPPVSAPEIVTGTTPPVALSEDSSAADNVAAPQRTLHSHSRERLESRTIAARTRTERKTDPVQNLESLPLEQGTRPDAGSLDRRRNAIPIKQNPGKLRIEIDSAGQTRSGKTP